MNSWPMVTLRGCVWVGAKFLKPWQVTGFWKFIEWIWGQMCITRGKFLWVTDNSHIKLLIEFFPNSHSYISWVNLTQNIITGSLLKIHEWIWGDVYEQGKSFLSHDKSHIKFIEWIFSQFSFNILWVTNSENNLIGFQKFMTGFEGMCMTRGKIS